MVVRVNISYIVVLVMLCVFLSISFSSRSAFGQGLSHLIDLIEKRDYEEKNDTQTMIAIPSFLFESDGYDNTTTFIFREALRSTFRSWEPKKTVKPDGKEYKRWYGSGLGYFIPRPMENSSHKNAVLLAQRNFMQAVAWGVTNRYRIHGIFDGYVVTTYFTYAGLYKDFREDPLEIWKITDDEYNFSVGIPRNNIDLPVYFIDSNVYNQFKNKEICFRNRETRKCRFFDYQSKTQVRSLSNGTISVTEFGNSEIYYDADLPNELFAPNPAIAYVAMFFAYSRGDWQSSIKHSNTVISSKESSVSHKVDAYLYKGASKFRQGLNGIKDINSAKLLSPRSPVVAKYTIMANYLLYRAGYLSEDDYNHILKKELLLIDKKWYARVKGQV